MAKAKNTQNKVEFKVKNLSRLSNFITQFKSIDTNLLLEFIDDKIVSRTYNPSESVAKMSEIDIDVIMEPLTDIPENFKLGIFNIDKFIKILNLIRTDDVTLIVYYTTEKDGSNFSLKLELQTPILNKTIMSASKNLFKTLSLEQTNNAFDTEDAYFKIDFIKDKLKQLTELISLENSRSFDIKYKAGELYFTGKEFSLKFDQDIDKLTNETVTFSLEKDAFKYADKEDYELYGKENSIILYGKETGTKIALALLEDMDETLSEYSV